MRTIRYRRRIVSTAFLIFAVLVAIAEATQGQNTQDASITFIPNGIFFSNPAGASEVSSASSGGIDLTGPFFQRLGTNDRTCATCHQPSVGMSVSAANV